jgi:outer membrane receptor protein involved in Fe transport
MTSRILSVIVIVIGMSCLPAPAEAADPNDPNGSNPLFDMSLEELMTVEVQSAGFFPTTTTKAPGYVMVYDMGAMRETSVRTLGDLMELYVPGAVVGAHERQGRVIGTRGLEIDNNAKTLVMWDGQQINYRSHFGYMVGLLSPMMGDVSRVEVIHGPGAIQHGSGAINGFINMIPKTGTSDPGGYTHYEYGFEEKSNLYEAGYGLKYGENRDVYVYGGGYTAEGFEPDAYWHSTKNYAGDVDAFGTDRGNYRFSTTWNHDNFNLDWFTYSFSPQKNSANESGYFTNEAMGVRPKYTFELTESESVDLIGSLLWGDFGTRGHNGEAILKGASEQHEEIKPIFKTTRLENHQIAVGGLAGYKKFRTTDFFFSHQPEGNFECLDTHWHEIGAFAEDVVSLTDALTVSLGLRYDEYNLSTMTGFWPEATTRYTPEEMDGHWSPRAAFAYEIDKATNIKGSYQHGFRMPDAAYYQFNLYNNSIAQANGYPVSSLEPEEMDSWELNLQHVFSKKLEGGLNLYYNTFTDQLSWGPLSNVWTAEQVAKINETSQAPWGMFQNIKGRFDIWGTEVLAKYHLTDWTTVGVSYGFAKCVGNEIEQHYPPHQIKFDLMSRFLDDRLLIGLNYVYNSHYTHSINPTIAEIYENDRNLVDASVVYKINKNLRVKGVAQNLFADRTPPSGYLMGVPSKGNLGYDETRCYLSLEFVF